MKLQQLYKLPCVKGAVLIFLPECLLPALNLAFDLAQPITKRDYMKLLPLDKNTHNSHYPVSAVPVISWTM